MALRSRHHRLIRFMCALVTAGSLTYMAQHSNVRKDVTQERLSEITGATTELVKSISPERPVVIHAYISKEVPRDYVTTRARLLNVLREFQAAGSEGLTVRIIEPEPYSPEADEASDKYQIEPVRLMNREGGRLTDMQVFLGLAMVSGPHEDVIPFFDRGLSVEYELVRALRTVTQEKKKVVGVLRTDATIMGNFDLQARRQQPAWRVIGELKKQYEVRSLNPKAAIPEDVDVLLVPQLSSCAQDELEHVKAFIDAGRPALLTVDPFPLFDLRLSPREPKLPPPGQQNQMFGMQQQGAEPKGDYEALLRHVGVEWNPDKVVFDLDNPNKIAAQAPPHIVFMTRPFEGGDPVVDGLSEVVGLFSGSITPVAGAEAEFVPLLQVGDRTGTHPFEELVQRHPLFGVSGPIIPRTRTIDGIQHVVGARVAGAATSGEESKPRNVIVLADLDIFGDQFFAFHERGGDIDGDGLVDIRFDNVMFLLNAIDSLAGDESLVNLRKRRSKYRRLTTIDELTKEAVDQKEDEVKKASERAEAEIAQAKSALEAKVKEIQEREGVDETTKAVLIQSAEDAENRRLNAKTERIEREKARAITRAEAELARKVDDQQNMVRLFAVLVPPIPALLLGGLIFGRRRRRERDAIPAARKKRGAA